jgi:hypothetical protein
LMGLDGSPCTVALPWFGEERSAKNGACGEESKGLKGEEGCGEGAKGEGKGGCKAWSACTLGSVSGLARFARAEGGGAPSSCAEKALLALVWVGAGLVARLDRAQGGGGTSSCEEGLLLALVWFGAGLVARLARAEGGAGPDGGQTEKGALLLLLPLPLS